MNGTGYRKRANRRHTVHLGRPAGARAEPGIGHNGGPVLEEPDPGGWRQWCWRRAHKRAWSAPREIALRRLARAEALGITYRDYTLEILERGRHL